MHITTGCPISEKGIIDIMVRHPVFPLLDVLMPWDTLYMSLELVQFSHVKSGKVKIVYRLVFLSQSFNFLSQVDFTFYDFYGNERYFKANLKRFERNFFFPLQK